jgi:pilus assembly protein CpaE
LNAGADHYVRKRPGADVELIATIHASLAQSKKSGLASSRGRIFSFCSAKGGTGTTSVCVNIAYALAKLEPKAEILVVDMVFPLGSVGPSLGYESHKTVCKLSQEGKDRIDRSTVERYVSQSLTWGFRVLIGANDPQEAGTLDVGQIAPIFETLKTMYDYIFVDFGRGLSRISLPIIESSTAVVVIVTPDISTLKASRLIIEFLESRNLDRNRIVLTNNRTVGRVWTTTEEIERELTLELDFTIPYVVEYMTMAVNEGVPFMAKFPENSACMVFNDIARLLRERDKAKTT